MVDESLRRRLTNLARIAHVSERLGRAPGRSPRNIAQALERRVADVESRESVLEDFVAEALRRFRLPPPTAQHVVFVGGRRRRIDLCYVEQKLALEAKGYEYHGGRVRFDDDALRGNDLLLAGFRVLTFTSAFTDLQIAMQVSAALDLPLPGDLAPLTFEEWKRLH